VQKAMPSLMVAIIAIAAFAYKEPVEAFFGDSSTGRGAFWGGVTGATVGGLAGGGRGAGIGAAVGLGTGALIGAAADSDRNGGDSQNKLYKRLDRLQSKRDKVANRLAGASDKNRARLERQLDSLDSQISDLEARLGVQPRGGYGQQARGGYGQQPMGSAGYPRTGFRRSY
jgi:hypothetical protein